MKKLSIRLAAAVAAVMLVAGPASAEPQVVITGPADGTVISRSQTPSLSVSGLAEFDTPEAATRRFFLRRNGCGQGQDNTTFLSTTNGTNGGEGCGYVGGWNLLGTADEEGFAVEFPAQNGVPLTLDGSQPITARIRMSNYQGVTNNLISAGIGQANLTATLTAEGSGGSETLGTQTVTKTILPTPVSYDYDFSFTPPAGSDKKDYSGLSLRIKMSGPGAGHGYLAMNGGVSYVNLPIYTASFNRRVEFALNSAAFSGTGVATDLETGTWSRTLPTPPAGAHVLKARAVQGSVVSAVDQIAIQVTS